MRRDASAQTQSGDEPWELDLPLFCPSSVSMEFGKLKSCTNYLFSNKTKAWLHGCWLASGTWSCTRPGLTRSLWAGVDTQLPCQECTLPSEDTLIFFICEKYWAGLWDCGVSPAVLPWSGPVCPHIGPTTFVSSHCPSNELLHFPCTASLNRPEGGRGHFLRRGRMSVLFLSCRVCHQCELGTVR